MSDKTVTMESRKWKRVTEPEELFFFAFYGFNAYWAVGMVDKKCANRVKQKTGINITGYNIVVRSDGLRHFYNSHYGSNETRQDSRAIHFDDIRAIPLVVNAFSYVEAGNRLDTLMFEKSFPSGHFQFVVTIDEQRKRLQGKSFRINT